MLNFDVRVKNSDAAQPRVTNVKTPIASISKSVLCVAVVVCFVPVMASNDAVPTDAKRGAACEKRAERLHDHMMRGNRAFFQTISRLLRERLRELFSLNVKQRNYGISLKNPRSRNNVIWTNLRE